MRRRTANLSLFDPYLSYATWGNGEMIMRRDTLDHPECHTTSISKPNELSGITRGIRIGSTFK